MSAPKLKPCPFCGPMPKHPLGRYPTPRVFRTIREEEWGTGKVYQVVCLYCGAEQPRVSTERDAIAAWNRRTP